MQIVAFTKHKDNHDNIFVFIADNYVELLKLLIESDKTIFLMRYFDEQTNVQSNINLIYKDVENKKLIIIGEPDE